MNFHAHDDVDHGIVAKHRALGRDIVTVMDVGRRGLSDMEQLVHAMAEGTALITFNRDDFHALHRQHEEHAGIITCTRDPDVTALAAHIDAAISTRARPAGELI